MFLAPPDSPDGSPRNKAGTNGSPVVLPTVQQHQGYHRLIMPIDPSVSLAVTVQSNKGVYALLVGSGLSRSAGVPTGWDVMTDLIRRVAVTPAERMGLLRRYFEPPP
jgi:hypothetical protein